MKKYYPSGYAIINIDATGIATGSTITNETEDVKVLKEILQKSDKNSKPILLTVKTNNNLLSGFAVRNGNAICLNYGLSVSTSLILYNNTIQIEYQEV